MFKFLTRWRDELTRLEERLVAIEGALAGVSTATTQPYDDRAVLQAIDDLQDQVQAHTHAIAEGIDRVDRSERRVRAAVQRAQKRLRDAGFEDETVEAEAAQLRLDYGQGSGGDGMHTVHRDMAERPAFDLGAIFPGKWSQEHTNKLLGG